MMSVPISKICLQLFLVIWNSLLKLHNRLENHRIFSIMLALKGDRSIQEKIDKNPIVINERVIISPPTWIDNVSIILLRSERLFCLL